MAFGLLLVSWVLPPAHASAVQPPQTLRAAARLLKVELPSQPAQYRKAYRAAALIVHPDVSSLGAHAASDFIAVTQAYHMLMRSTASTAASTAPAEWRQPTQPDPGAHGRQSRRVVAYRDYWHATLLASRISEQADAQRAQLTSRALRDMREARLAVAALDARVTTLQLRAFHLQQVAAML